jgi:hypothetical protein
MADSKNEVPEGVMPVEIFAKQKGIDEKKVTDMVRDGFYIGQIIDGKWYIDAKELDEDKQSFNSTGKTSRTFDHTPALSIFFFVIAALNFLGGIILAAEFWPGDPGYGREWETEAYTFSIVWFMVGALQAALFAAIGQGLSFLHQIVKNTAHKAGSA